MKLREGLTYLLIGGMAAGVAGLSGCTAGMKARNNAASLIGGNPGNVRYLEDCGGYYISNDGLGSLELIAGLDVGTTTVTVEDGELEMAGSGFNRFTPAHREALLKALAGADTDPTDHTVTPGEIKAYETRVALERYGPKK